MDTTADSSVTTRSRPYRLGEEIANSVTHGVGALLSVVGLIVLVAYSVLTGDPVRVVASVVYGVSLVLEYTASTLYHALPQPRAKHVFKILDHSGIYLLIAGSYTPFLLITLQGAGGWWMAAGIWALALIGIVVEGFWAYRPKWLSASVYLLMGWLAIFAIKPMIANLPSQGVALLVAGGLAYTIGTPFYVLKKVPYFHMVWHLWVLAGSALHFFAVLLYVLPVK
jgi:hemolysin III